jgi:hypothetical protein
MSIRPILFACASLAALAGCGHTVYRETVVERQPVVTRETVVERPAVAAPAVVAPAVVAPAPSAPSAAYVAIPGPNAACALGAAAYPHGTLSCQAAKQYQCVDGVWQPLIGTSC